MSILLEALGFASSALVVFSTAQRVWRVAKKPEPALNEDFRRNAMQ